MKIQWFGIWKNEFKNPGKLRLRENMFKDLKEEWLIALHDPSCWIVAVMMIIFY